MALDFPSSPTLNQTYSGPNNTVWTWDGTKWTTVNAAFGSAAYADLGTSGHTVPYLDGVNTFSAVNTFSNTNTVFNNANAGLEIGSTSVAGTPYIDFHSTGSANDYDARILATGGTAGTGSLAYIQMYAARLYLVAPSTVPGFIIVQGNDATNAGGPYVDLDRNSASPAASDVIGVLRFLGRNSSAAQIAYVQIQASITSPTAGAENSNLLFYTQSGGNNVLNAELLLNSGVTSYGPGNVAVAGGAMGYGTANFNTFYEAGVALSAKYFQKVGITNAGNAPAGEVGEFITQTVSAVSIGASGLPRDVTSISLTAGDWDVWGSVLFNISGACTIIMAGIALSSNSNGAQMAALQLGVNIGTGSCLVAPPTRVNVSTTTTVYLEGRADFTTGTVTANGTIMARRRR